MLPSCCSCTLSRTAPDEVPSSHVEFHLLRSGLENAVPHMLAKVREPIDELVCLWRFTNRALPQLDQSLKFAHCPPSISVTACLRRRGVMCFAFILAKT